MHKIRQDISSAKSPEEAQVMRQQVAARLEDAVRATGLSLEDYSRIAHSIRADRSLMERFDKILNATAEKEVEGRSE